MKNKLIAWLVCMAVTQSLIAQKDPQQDSIFKEAAKTELWKPVPLKVTPGQTNSDAPSDAIILFNGTDTKSWQKTDGTEPGWKIDAQGVLNVVKGSGSIQTKEAYGSCQLHIEWKSPAEIAGEGQTRGNSGVYLMGRYELQILDAYNNPTYVNGQAGSIYKQHIPLVNAAKKPGEWQSYDVVFTAPVFSADGVLQDSARFTVFHNGVLIQNNVKVKGSAEWIGPPSYKAHKKKEQLMLQDHGFDGGNPVAFRNIWIRPLRYL
jgi:hypothetical protein